MLLSADDTTPLVHHKMRLGEFTCRLESSAIHHLLSGTEKFLELFAVNMVCAIGASMRAFCHRVSEYTLNAHIMYIFLV